MKQILSQRRSRGLSYSLMFVGFAVLAAFDAWWPSILLVIGIALALKNFLLGKLYEMTLSLIIFIGVYIGYRFQFKGEVALTVIFGLAATYFFLKEFIGPAEPEETEAELEEDLNHEIEEDSGEEK